MTTASTTATPSSSSVSCQMGRLERSALAGFSPPASGWAAGALVASAGADGSSGTGAAAPAGVTPAV